MPILMIGLAGVLLTFVLRHPGVTNWHLQHNWPAAFTFTALNILPLVAVLSTIGRKLKAKRDLYCKCWQWFFIRRSLLYL